MTPQLLELGAFPPLKEFLLLLPTAITTEFLEEKNLLRRLTGFAGSSVLFKLASDWSDLVNGVWKCKLFRHLKALK